MRKCKLDHSLLFEELLDALVIYPDREADWIAYVSTMSFWCQWDRFFNVMLAMQSSKHAKMSQIKKFLMFVSSQRPWSDEEGIFMLKQFEELDKVYETQLVEEETIFNESLLRDALNQIQQRTPRRDTLVVWLSAHAYVENDGSLARRGKHFLKNGAAKCHVNFDQYCWFQCLTTGFQSVNMADVEDGDSLHRVVLVSEIIAATNNMSLVPLSSLYRTGVLDKLKEDNEDEISSKSSLFLSKFGKSLFKHPAVVEKQKTASVQSGVPPVVEFDSSMVSTFITMDMKETARQLSLMFHELYRSIRVCHFSSVATENNPAKLLFSHVQNISNHVARIILLHDNTKFAISQFVTLGHWLMLYNNFCAAFAVTLGLSMHVVTRLKCNLEPQTENWRGKLMELIDNAKNHLIYKQTLATVKNSEPCLPYVGLALQSVTLIKEGNDTLLEDQTINREKVLMLSKALQRFLHFQNNFFVFAKVGKCQRQIEESLLSPEIPSEDELYELSYKVFPMANE